MSSGASLSSLNQSLKGIDQMGGNIASSAVTAAKTQSTYYQAIQGGEGVLGVKAVNKYNIDTQGTLDATSNANNLAIQGRGFFVVTDKVSSDGTIGNIFFTRDGSFEEDNNQRFVNAAGYALLGWKLNADGSLPDSKSIIASLVPISIEKGQVSESSATTEVKLGYNLKSTTSSVSGGKKTIEITNTSSKNNPVNAYIDSKMVLVPNGKNNISQKEGMEFIVNDVSKKLVYDGFSASTSLNVGGSDLVANGGTKLTTDSFQISIGSSQFTVPRGSAATNLEVMESIAHAINTQTLTEADRLSARVVNDGTKAALYIAPIESEKAITFTSNTGDLSKTLNLKDVDQFIQSTGSDVSGRFNSLYSLQKAINGGKVGSGISATIVDNPASGASLSIDAGSKSLSINNYNSEGKGSDFLQEFGLTSGFLTSSYDPYDADNNMAGRNNTKFKPTFSKDFTVYDTQGNSHTMMIGFLKVNTNKWAVEIYANDKNDVAVNGRIDGLLMTGIMEFDSSGRLSGFNDFIQTSKSSEFQDPTEDLGAQIGQTFGVKVGNTDHNFVYGKMYAVSSNFLAADTDLTTGTNATDVLSITVNGSTYDVPRGTAANNLDVLNNMKHYINTQTNNDLSADVVYDRVNSRYNLKIFPNDKSLAVSFGGTAGLTTALGINSADDIAANSFLSLIDLAEQINSTSGTNAIKAELISGDNSGYYQLVIKPTTSEEYLSFSGDEDVVNPPAGNGTKTTVSKALGFKDTSATTRINGLADKLSIQWSSKYGAQDNEIKMFFGETGTNLGMSQLSSDFTTKKDEQNGISAGTFESHTFDKYGNVTAHFSNSQVRDVYKVALADFANPNGLTPLSGGVYVATKDSGPLNLKEAGKEGVGEINSSMLEGSNVDVNTQLTDTVYAQRQFMASTKTLMAEHELTKDLISQIRV
jgi:flagellar hook protein FlgE